MHPEDRSSTDLGERLAAQAPRLRLLLTHLAGPAMRARVDVDDLLQEVFLRAITSDQAGQLPADDGDLHRFLVVLCRNVVVDAARFFRARKRSAADGPDQRLAHGDWSRYGPRASQVLAETMGPATRAGANEAAERLRRAYQDLEADHRRVLGLRQFQGLSAREAGARMGRSEVAIHSLYRRALAAWEAAVERLGEA